VEIVTARLRLREFVPADWPAVLAYQSDPRYLRYYDWSERTEEAVRAFVARFISWQAQEPRLKFQLAITLPAEGRLIGNCGLRLESAGETEADLGYELAPGDWGQGYASEAAAAMLRVGFAELGLHRIWGACVAENTVSARVMEKLGMRHEGRLRQNRWMKGLWWDTLLYGILRPEWAAAQAAAQARGVEENDRPCATVSAISS
jgi:ribosomal-protein-alanine N-acetyltransferase